MTFLKILLASKGMTPSLPQSAYKATGVSCEASIGARAKALLPKGEDAFSLLPNDCTLEKHAARGLNGSSIKTVCPLVIFGPAPRRQELFSYLWQQRSRRIFEITHHRREGPIYP